MPDDTTRRAPRERDAMRSLLVFIIGTDNSNVVCKLCDAKQSKYLSSPLEHDKDCPYAIWLESWRVRSQAMYDASPRQARTEQDMREALRELYAIVQGECPRLLDEDRGGSGELAIRIAALLEVASTSGGGDYVSVPLKPSEEWITAVCKARQKAIGANAMPPKWWREDTMWECNVCGQVWSSDWLLPKECVRKKPSQQPDAACGEGKK